MRVTKTSEQSVVERSARSRANIGCNVCPCCGESMSVLEAIKSGLGLSRGVGYCKTVLHKVKTGIFRCEEMWVDVYHCLTCGAQWEGRPWKGDIL